MRKASLAFSLLSCLFLTLSCSQNDDFFLLEEQSLQKSETEKGFLVDDVVKEEMSSCADVITNVNYHNLNDGSKALAITWSYVAPLCGSICPPPGLIEYDIEIQTGNVGTYGAFWGTIFSFSHIDSSTVSELIHYVSFDEIGGKPQLTRFRVKLKSCNTYSEWVTSSVKFR